MIKPLRSTIAITLPTEDQNYVLNPSAEIDGNFAASGAATVNRSTSFQKYGLYSYEVTTSGGDGIELSLLTLPAIDIYVTFRMIGSPQTDINIGTTATQPRLLERIDSQWNLWGARFTASEVSGQTVMEIEKTDGGLETFYIDGVQVSQLIDGRYYTTYIDGTQEGCRWLGASHASSSVRSGDSRAGGVVTSFWEGFNFFPEKALGLGTTVEELNIDSYAFLPGGELNSSKIPPREFTIIGYFLADTVEELHEHAQRLELELGLNTYPSRQPIRLRYSGARVLKEISANYTGGLEGDLPIYYNDDWSQEDEAWVRNYKFKMRASIQFVALDPFWYEVGESATILDTNDTDTSRVVAARLLETGQWSVLGPPGAGGTYGSVLAIAEDSTYVYLGGDFTNFDGIAAADNIVRYHKQSGVYSAMDAGLSSIVRAIAIAPNGDVIVGGQFQNASGVAAADYIAVWAVGAVAFTALGNPNSGGASITSVYALFYDPTGILWIGGSFANWAGIANGDGIVTWTGAAYAAPAVGANGIVVTFAHDGTYLYVGGSFSTIGGVSIDSIASWDGSVYAVVGDGIPSNAAGAIAVWNGTIVVGLSITPYLMVLQGQLWSLVGGITPDNAVTNLAVGPDGTLFLSGTFTTLGNLTLTNRMARFNGYSFSHLDAVLPTTNIQVIYPSTYEIDPLVPENYTLWLGYSGTGTSAFAGIVTCQNEGTIAAFPKIVFSRSGGDGATITTLRNERTGQELLFDYSLLDGESLIINLNPKNRTIVSSFFGPRMNARLANDDFSTWQLLPGDNPISSFVDEDGSPTITAYILFREPYKSWN